MNHVNYPKPYSCTSYLWKILGIDIQLIHSNILTIKKKNEQSKYFKCKQSKFESIEILKIFSKHHIFLYIFLLRLFKSVNNIL